MAMCAAAATFENTARKRTKSARPGILPAGDAQVVSMAFTFDGLRFETPGMYSWVISIDGTAVKRLAMRVQHLAEATPVH